MRFEHPDRFVVGTLGAPGERTFVIEARQGDQVAAVVVEKVQVRLLAERLTALIEGVATLGEVRVPRRPESPRDRSGLDLPWAQGFRAGEIRLGWDRPSARLIIEFEGAETDSLTVHLRLEQVQEFIARAEVEVASGRPACPFCSQPLDPAGHLCPRTNGFRSVLFEP